MDRSVLEGNPHSVIEGMIIGAYAIGAQEGFVYVRDEYPLAIRELKIAIQQAEKVGLLGENILGSGFSISHSSLPWGWSFCLWRVDGPYGLYRRKGRRTQGKTYPYHGKWFVG